MHYCVEMLCFLFVMAQVTVTVVSTVMVIVLLIAYFVFLSPIKPTFKTYALRNNAKNYLVLFTVRYDDDGHFRKTIGKSVRQGETKGINIPVSAKNLQVGIVSLDRSGGEIPRVLLIEHFTKPENHCYNIPSIPKSSIIPHWRIEVSCNFFKI